MKKIIYWSIGAVLVVIVGIIAVGVYKFNLTNDDLIVPVNTEAPKADEVKTPPVGLANPASTNCIAVGGTLKIVSRGDGGQYGLCYFEDNRACEEWALMRGECPVGGVKTTGFDTEAQRYCAWLGGETFAVENATCTFKDGRVCPDEDLYNGKECVKSVK